MHKIWLIQSFIHPLKVYTRKISESIQGFKDSKFIIGTSPNYKKQKGNIHESLYPRKLILALGDR